MTILQHILEKLVLVLLSLIWYMNQLFLKWPLIRTFEIHPVKISKRQDKKIELLPKLIPWSSLNNPIS